MCKHSYVLRNIAQMIETDSICGCFFFFFLIMELKILEKIKKEKRFGLFMNREFMELNNGFVHHCYLISLDKLLVSFRFFIMWIIVVGCGL